MGSANSMTSMRQRIILLSIYLLIILCTSIRAQRSIFSIGIKVLQNSSSTPKSTGRGETKVRRNFFASANEVEGKEEHDIFGEEEKESVEGKARNTNHQSCEVGFENIKIVLKQKGKKPDRIILDGSIRGAAKPGRMLAVMGPSGSGKSSLVQAVTGRVRENKKIIVSGQRYINGEFLSGNLPLPAAIIEQETNFFPYMTVKETLDFRVELKLGSKLRKLERDELVYDLMVMLGLSQSADTIVGNSKIRGLSGGERKRLSIACELITNNPIVVVDEPTSGLDSYQAAQVIEFLRKLADGGKTIIAVIHQPSQNIFSMFDDLLLLSEGRMMYYGEVSKVHSYMNTLGFPLSVDTGLAEHVLNCISRTNGGPQERKESDERLNVLASAAIKSTNNIKLATNTFNGVKKYIPIAEQKVGPAANLFRQFKLLLSRSFRETTRGKAAIIIKAVQQVTLGLIYGGIYKVGIDQASIMDRFGLLSLIAIGSMNMAVASTIRSFTKEKSIVASEIAGNMYRTLPYFLAKAISEIPMAGIFNAMFGAIIYPLAGLQKGKFKQFLGLTTLHTLACEALGLFIGALAPTSDVALSLFPAVVVLNIIFDGRNISEENTPRLIKFLPKISVIRWGFEGLSVNEFNGLTFTINGPKRGPVVKTGNEALARFGMSERNLMEVVDAQLNIVGVCWLLSFFGLSLTSANFETMLAS